MYLQPATEEKSSKKYYEIRFNFISKNIISFIFDPIIFEIGKLIHLQKNLSKSRPEIKGNINPSLEKFF